MIAAPEYSLKAQVKLVLALCVLHNFICTFDPNDLDVEDLEEIERRSLPRNPSDFGGAVDATERRCADARHDVIAKEMWVQYVAYIVVNI